MESKLLGDYHIIKQIGQGSLGCVLLAEHRFMKKQYVLKVLPEELSNDRNFISRFEEDVGTLSSLDHPNIVKIHNISFAQGQYFLVTDCIVDELGETTNLAQYVHSRKKRLEEIELIRILRAIAEALDYAHNKKVAGKGITHRGIKLNNILIGKGKTANEPFLTDFGLSKIIGPAAVLTRTYKIVGDTLGINLGTAKIDADRYSVPTEGQKIQPLHASFLQNFAFLAPEQKRLDHPYQVDVKTDVYAFGVLAYYLIAGEFPEGMFEMPSEKAPEYRGHWDHLVCACLQNVPEKRPDSLISLMDEIYSAPIQGHTAEKNLPPTNKSEPIHVMEQKHHSEGSLKPIIHLP